MMNDNIRYENIISLGYNCHIAKNLEEMGLRNKSYPFDWVLSQDFLMGVKKLIDNNFDGLFDLDYFSQNCNSPNIYKNIKYSIIFVHDFDKYHTIYEQIPEIKKKYDRRIKRFYEDVKKPTLFIRYLKDYEVSGVVRRQQDIVAWLKEFNSNNEIIYVSGNIECELLNNGFFVEKDDNDPYTSWTPLYKNEKLKNYLDSLDYKNRDQNIAVYRKKEKKKNILIFRIIRKVKNKYYSSRYGEYKHKSQYT